MPDEALITHALASMPKPGDKLFLPYPGLTLVPKWHPLHDEVEKKIAVEDRHYLRDHYQSDEAADAYIAQRISTFGGLCYPNAQNDRIYWVERAMVVTTLMEDALTHSTTIRDDGLRDECRRHCIAAMEGIRPPEDAPLPRYLYDTYMPIKAQLAAKPRVWDRLKDGLIAQITVADTHQLQQVDALSFQDYMELRRADAFGDLITTFAEYALDIDMSDALDEEDSLRAVGTAAVDSVILVNDLFSFRKEASAKDSFSSIWILMRESKLDLQGALDQLADLCASTERRLIDASNKVLSGRLGWRDDVRRYVAEMGHLSSGNAEFSAISARYHGTDLSDTPFTSGEVTILEIPSPDAIAASNGGR